ncbi:MAG: BNR-4 repeat-containing protein, partial [Bacteroidales bacterium]|nr:BNR-4 repeat-containing protein [Bacteroidales bacterium]
MKNPKRKQRIFMPACLFILLIPCMLSAQDSKSLNNLKVNGYRGIWFELNQKYEYGDKYSGGLGTYTAKHIPLAAYAPAVDKTFFVYGGTVDSDQRHLLCMIGEFDHKTQLVSRPTVVYDKSGVDDPHDDPTIMIDDDGYIWVFVSGRGNSRKGIKLRSNEPYDINEFTQVSMEVFAYPQIWNTKIGFFHFFTKYTGVRELYFETSSDGFTWTEDAMLAGIKESPVKKSGHYQVSNHFNDGAIIGTFFNRHRDGHPDTRTDLYYIQTRDFGETWEDIDQRTASLPMTEVEISQRIIDYQSMNKNVYMKDMGFDSKGNPV